MIADRRYVLPDDVLLFSLDELADDVRARLRDPGRSFALTRPGSRSTTKVVDEPAARLLEEFRSPATFVQAVVAVADATGADPRLLLESAFPMLARLRGAGLLVEASGELDGAIRPSLSPGASFAGFEVVRCLQVVEDVEVYEARDSAGGKTCLKIARSAAPAPLEAEARVLAQLRGGVAPSLVAAGVWGDREYVAMEWLGGKPVTAVADVLRDPWADDSAARLRTLCVTVARAYATLHAAGFLHVDVHPRNVLASGPEDVRLVDFGLARRAGDGGDGLRGGVGFFFEPEHARAVVDGVDPPAPSERGEQHAVAALLYLLVTGHHYLDFALERDEVFAQIAGDAPVPFAARGRDWPALEDVLRRALSKEPARRFDSMADLASALEAAPLPAKTVVTTAGKRGAAIADYMQRFEGAEAVARGVGYEPAASVNYGAAGVACAFYELALLRDDAHYLALADAWAERAAASIHTDGAFSSDELEIGPDEVDAVSLYHGAPGVHCVRALIASARSDWDGIARSTGAFVASARGAFDHVDVTTGRSGGLLGAALLVDALGDDAKSLPELGELGGDLCETVTSLLDDGREVEFLGAAHGWAGLAYAALAWARAAGAPVAAPVVDRLERLAELAQSLDGALGWPVTLERREDPSAYWPGWCHGSAGYVLTWTLAARVLDRDDFAELAIAAGRHTARALGGDSASLCCGTSGQTFALLELQALTGDAEWAAAARRAADAGWRSIGAGRPYAASLYKGELGPILAAAAVAAPGEARMPLFGLR